MPLSAKQIDTIRVSLDPSPGALAKVYSAFKESGVNVLASWGYQMGPDQAQAHFYPSDTAKAKDVLVKMGKKPFVEKACYAEGDDKIGAYGELLQKVANAGVNVEATDAYAINGKFATVLFVEDKDMPALCKALGC